MALALRFVNIFSSSLVVVSRNPNAPRQGDDLQYRASISSLKKRFLVRKVKYHREASCHTCYGSGPGTSPVTCGRCHGSESSMWIRKPSLG